MNWFQIAIGWTLVCLSAFSDVQAQETETVATVSVETGRVHIPETAIPPLAPDSGRFMLTDWGGPDIPVWTYVPVGTDPSSLPIVIVMHGANRDADRYLSEWRSIAQLEGFVIAAPEFSRADWPRAAGYNLGNVFREEGIDLQPEENWAFSAIELIFDVVREETGSKRNSYVLYGHSAGSQFVHRFLYYKPEARVSRYIAANAGWYTMPDMEEMYPYGLKKAHVSSANLAAALQKDVVVLLGTLDNDPNHDSLRRSAEAMRQGAHRFARGKTFIETAKLRAEEFGVAFNWQLAEVEGAVHANGQMVFGAVPFILNPRFVATPSPRPGP